MDEERYLYGDDRRGEERDPRKRKRQVLILQSNCYWFIFLNESLKK